MSFAIDNAAASYNNIKVIGVGGAGGNAVNNMIEKKIIGVETIAANTDRQILEESQASQKIILGEKITNSMGAGGDPSVGKRAADESRDVIAEALRGTDMLFIVAGMGGGTGTGAAPVVAEIAKEQGILTVAIVTRPFFFEGMRRSRQAEEGVNNLEQYVDSIIIIPNDKLANAGDKSLGFKNAFLAADDILCQGVKSISETITVPGYINLDFADIRSVMKNGGRAHMGIGVAKGADCGIEAVNQAISSPLLESDIKGATGVIINFTCSPEVPLDVIQQAGAKIQELTNPDCNVIFGSVFDESMGDEVSVTVIATGYNKATSNQEPNAPEKAEENSDELSDRIIERPRDEAASQASASEPIQPPVSSSSELDSLLNSFFGSAPLTPPQPAYQQTQPQQPVAPQFDDVYSQSAPAQPQEAAPADPIFQANTQPSVFDDDEDEGEEDIPIFKGRNLFNN